jgi:hypothetical protein
LLKRQKTVAVPINKIRQKGHRNTEAENDNGEQKSQRM